IHSSRCAPAARPADLTRYAALCCYYLMEVLLNYLVRILAWVFRRPFLKIRIIEDEPNQDKGGLKFEAENASPTLTSLHHVIPAKFLYPEKGRYRRGAATFD